MLLSAYSGSIAAAFAQPEPTPVSHWKLDADGVDAQGVSDLTLTGSPDTGLDTLVANDPGTSMAFDGSNDYGEATHDADWAVSAATIVGYCQPDSAPSVGVNRCILGKGSFISGEFQIEQYNDGGISKLRAYWHDGTSAYWLGASTGAVAIPVNVAFSFALAISSAGLYLYHRPAGGSWSLVASDPVAASLALNNENIFIGQSPYGGGFFDGVLDDVRFYHAALTLNELASLEAPSTNSPPPSEAVNVGTLAAFARSTIDVTALAGWPAGRLPKQILQQGAHASAYIRRAWKPSLNTGTHVDFVPGWQKTTGQETIRLQLNDDSQIDLTYTVGHTIPSHSGGGVTRTLDRSGGGDFTTWAAAVAALTSGDVLVVRAPSGTWTDSGGHSIPNYVYDVTNTPSPFASNVTVVAHPDDVAAGRRPILWRNAGRYARFKYDPANAWQVHANLGGGNVIYQSVATSPQPGHSIFAAYRDQVGDWISMYNYQAITDGTDRSGIMHDTSYPKYPGINSSTYMGPSCIYNKSTGRFEIRLNPPAEQTYQNPSAGLPWPPWDWTPHYPPSTDARNCEVVITDGSNFAGRNALLNLDGRNGWKFYNIDFVYGNRAIGANNQSTPPEFYGCSFLGGSPPSFENSGSDVDYQTTPSAVERFSGSPTTDMLFDRCSLHGANPPWGSWHEGKGFEGAFGLTTRRELTSYTANRMVLRYCKIVRWWHLTWMSQSPFTAPVKNHFHHNYIRDAGMDGLMLQRIGGEHVINRNFVPSCVYGGWTSPGGSGLFHRSFNVWLGLTAWCCSFPNLSKWANSQEDDVSTPCYAAPSSIPHAGQSFYSERHYHNTCVGSGNTLASTSFTTEGVGSGMGTDTRGSGNRIFNSIGAVYPYPVAWPIGRSSLVCVYCNNSSTYDYNVLHKSAEMPNPINGVNTFVQVNTGSGGTGTSYGSITALRSETGFETNGVQADPQFVVTPAWAASNPFGASGVYQLGNYMLGPSSPARTGGRNLNDQSFTDYDFETLTTFTGGNNTLFRGALDPSIPLIEQEVGIVGPAPPEIV